MTDLATYNPQAPALIEDARTVAVQRIGEWAESAQAAYGVAERLVQTSFVPQAFRGKPMEATAAILSGAEVGLSPMASLKAFDIIQGQAAPRAITIRAVVQSRGHEMVQEESTPNRCTMRGRRKGSHEWQSVTWTIDRARNLGLTTKDQWQKQPQAMLVARATSELGRLIASDALLGIPYSAEELEDAESAPTVAVQRKQTTTVQRKAAPPPEPVLEPEPDVDEVSVDLITDAQMRKLRALLGEAGMGGRDQREQVLAYVSEVIGRQVDSSKSLTKDEASVVIEALVALTAPVDAEPEMEGWK